MSDGCPRCSEFAARGSTFCGACGREIDGDVPQQRNESMYLGKILLFITAILVLVILAIELLALLLNLPAIFDLLAISRVSFPILIPFPTTAFTLSGIAAQVYFVMVVVVIFACAAYAIKKFIDAARSADNIIESPDVRRTAITWVGMAIGVSLVVNFVVVMIAVISGQEIIVPDFGDKIQQMFLLADAAFWEEIVTRVLYIGVPITIISLIMTRKKESLKCLFGGFGMSTSALVFIILSGAIFGIAHFSGWDDQYWKVLATGIMGMLMGYIFVRFGLYATILLHFINNYLSSFDWIGIGGVQIIVTFALLILGLAALLYILYKLFTSKDKIRAMPWFMNGYIEQNKNE